MTFYFIDYNLLSLLVCQILAPMIITQSAHLQSLRAGAPAGCSCSPDWRDSSGLRWSGANSLSGDNQNLSSRSQSNVSRHLVLPNAEVGEICQLAQLRLHLSDPVEPAKDYRHKESLFTTLELPPQVECGEAGELVDHGGDVDKPVVPTVQHTQVLKHSDTLKMTFNEDSPIPGGWPAGQADWLSHSLTDSGWTDSPGTPSPGAGWPVCNVTVIT